MKVETYTAALPLELREAGDRLEGVILQEGRAGSARAELFTPGSLIWNGQAGSRSGLSIEGARLRARSRLAIRTAKSESARKPRRKSVRRSTRAGGFCPSSFRRLPNSARRRASGRSPAPYVEAAAMTDDPEYTQATAELRSRSGRRRFWL